jgi:hypothetical protein
VESVFVSDITEAILCLKDAQTAVLSQAWVRVLVRLDDGVSRVRNVLGHSNLAAEDRDELLTAVAALLPLRDALAAIVRPNSRRKHPDEGTFNGVVGLLSGMIGRLELVQGRLRVRPLETFREHDGISIPDPGTAHAAGQPDTDAGRGLG